MRLLAKKDATVASKTRISLVTLVDQHSQITEQYRTLRTNLQTLLLDRKMKSIMVTSSGSKEGKSTTAANLAIVFASAGNRTLLVDANLRKPVIAQTFFSSDPMGLSNLLTKQKDRTASLSSLAQATQIKNLTVLPSGPIPLNPAELVESDQMSCLLEEMYQYYDIILLDTPPIMVVADAQALASKVDGTLMVVRENVTKKDELLRARQLLQLVKANVFGIVYNGSERVSAAYYYGL